VVKSDCIGDPEIRRLFGQGGGGHDSWRRVAQEAVQFDLSKFESQKPKGHVVAVRVTSEDPDDGFKPTSGQVQVSCIPFFNLGIITSVEGYY